MITPQSQIKLNLPLGLKDYLESKAKKFDMPLAGYIKHLILKDVSDMDYPVFHISDASLKKAKNAMKNMDKAIPVDDVSKYFDEL